MSAPYLQDRAHSAALVEMYTQNDTQTAYAAVPKKAKSSKSKSGRSDDNASLFSTGSFSSTRHLLKNTLSSSSSKSKSR